MTTITCDCDPDEMLPCEEHMVVLAQREGASARTGDELLSVWVHDAVFFRGVELSPWGRDLLSRYDAALESNRRFGVAWLPDGRQVLAEEMDTLRNQVEVSLALLDEPVYTHWDDGYIMYSLTEDCPLREDV